MNIGKIKTAKKWITIIFRLTKKVRCIGMKDLNFEDIFKKFKKDHERPPLLKLADDWQKIADVSNELAARIKRV